MVVVVSSPNFSLLRGQFFAFVILFLHNTHFDHHLLKRLALDMISIMALLIILLFLQCVTFGSESLDDTQDNHNNSQDGHLNGRKK